MLLQFCETQSNLSSLLRTELSKIGSVDVTNLYPCLFMFLGAAQENFCNFVKLNYFCSLLRTELSENCLKSGKGVQKVVWKMSIVELY